MKLGVSVQHHPSRAYLLARLLPRLGTDYRVVIDPMAAHPFRSAWHAYHACLESLALDDTHLLIIQDDAIPCDGYIDALHAAISSQPDRVIVTCVCGNAKRNCRRMYLACDAGYSFAELDANEWCPTVATCYPAEVVYRLRDWIARRTMPEFQQADDSVIGEFLLSSGIGALMTVPSLVDHPDDTVSLVAPDDTRYGLAPERSACCYIGDCDPSSIVWRAA